jgi:hypothetical protein
MLLDLAIFPPWFSQSYIPTFKSNVAVGFFFAAGRAAGGSGPCTELCSHQSHAYWTALFGCKMSDSPSASPLLPVVIDDDSDSFVLIGSHDCCGACFKRKCVVLQAVAHTWI